MLRPFLVLSLLLWSAWSVPDFAAVLAAGLGVMPLAFFWAGCPCCGGCGTCEVACDDFTRADSSTVGGSWTEVSGAWSIESNSLLVETDSDGVLTHSASLTDGKGAITATIYSDNACLLNLIGAYTSTTDHLIARYQYGATDGTLYLVSMTAGVETILDTVTITGGGTGTTQIITLCWNGIGAVASHNGGQFIESATTKTGGAALGVTAFGPFGGTATFDDVAIKRDGSEDSQCPLCYQEPPDPLPCDYCDGEGTPAYIQVDIAGSGTESFEICDPCSGMDGTYLVPLTSACSYFGYVGPAICGYDAGGNPVGINVMSLQIGVGGTYKVRLTFYVHHLLYEHYIAFQHEFVSEPTCDEITDSLVLAYYSASDPGTCETSTATLSLPP